MLNPFQIFGRTGEAKAARFLKKNGYKILEKNFKNSLGEIDIIAMDGNSIVFVEVKTRSTIAFGSPKSAVNKRKRRKISMTAVAYLKNSGNTNAKARFDVVAISPLKGIELLKNAFDMEAR